MKRLIAFTAASLIAASPVLAGSPAAPAPDPVLIPAAVPAPTTPDWTGFYGGVQLGYGDVDTNVAGLGGDGALGGLNAGYDYDLGSWVLGAGLAYDWADIGLGGGSNVDAILRAKARLGYKIGNGLMYGTYGWAQVETNNLGTEDGYFLGGGYEHMVSDNMSVGGEVLYYDFNNLGAGSTTDLETTVFQVLATYRF
ncbi:outer membrane beta-barrel protein [Rhodobacteraceae bacterium KMM 6894]|nr:outer membrane beta-barrel protein [Rhodobacteraceae bacterium KMM 6894]